MLCMRGSNEVGGGVAGKRGGRGGAGCICGEAMGPNAKTDCTYARFSECPPTNGRVRVRVRWDSTSHQAAHHAHTWDVTQ